MDWSATTESVLTTTVSQLLHPLVAITNLFPANINQTINREAILLLKVLRVIILQVMATPPHILLVDIRLMDTLPTIIAVTHAITSLDIILEADIVEAEEDSINLHNGMLTSPLPEEVNTLNQAMVLLSMSRRNKLIRNPLHTKFLRSSQFQTMRMRTTILSDLQKTYRSRTRRQ